MDQSKQARQEFQELVKQASPNSPLWKNCLTAFLSGGLICVLGQVFQNMAKARGASPDMASLIATIFLVLIAALLTGLGWYARLGKHCGAGTIVPVTGFANSVVSPAIEFKKDDRVIIGTSQKHHEIKVDVLV